MDAIERGQRAGLILRDPAFQDAVGRLRERITHEWEEALSAEQRELAWYRLNALAQVCKELFADEQSGEFEARQQEERRRLLEETAQEMGL